MEELAAISLPLLHLFLKKLALPSGPRCIIPALVGKAYEEAGQASGSLHTMVVFQAYQADLMKELDTGEGLSTNMVKELRRATDLSFRTTK